MDIIKTMTDLGQPEISKSWGGNKQINLSRQSLCQLVPFRLQKAEKIIGSDYAQVMSIPSRFRIVT